MSQPRSVAIFGSCTTQDSVNRDVDPGHRRWYPVVTGSPGRPKKLRGRSTA